MKKYFCTVRMGECVSYRCEDLKICKLIIRFHIMIKWAGTYFTNGIVYLTAKNLLFKIEQLRSVMKKKHDFEDISINIFNNDHKIAVGKRQICRWLVMNLDIFLDHYECENISNECIVSEVERNKLE